MKKLLSYIFITLMFISMVGCSFEKTLPSDVFKLSSLSNDKTVTLHASVKDGLIKMPEIYNDTGSLIKLDIKVKDYTETLYFVKSSFSQASQKIKDISIVTNSNDVKVKLTRHDVDIYDFTPESGTLITTSDLAIYRNTNFEYQVDYIYNDLQQAYDVTLSDWNIVIPPNELVKTNGEVNVFKINTEKVEKGSLLVTQPEYFLMHSLSPETKTELLSIRPDKDYLVVFHQEGCSHCEEALTDMTDFFNNKGTEKLELYFVNSADIVYSDETYEYWFTDKYKDSVKDIEKFGVYGTPSFIYVKTDGTFEVGMGPDNIRTILNKYL